MSSSGAQGPAGPTGPAGAGVLGVLDLWNSQGNPGVIIDWGPIINAAIVAGWRAIYLQPNPNGTPRAFPYTTPIAANDTMGLCIYGPGGKVDLYGDSGVGPPAVMRVYLVYKGVGAATAFNAEGGSGFTLRGIGLYYDNAGFTGKLLSLNNNTAGTLIERNDIGSFDRANATAFTNIAYSNSWNCTVRDNTIQGAQYNFYGNDPAGGSVFCDTMRIQDNDIGYASVAHFGGAIRLGWKISRNFFSFHTAPGAAAPPQMMKLDKPGIGYLATFVFEDNDGWDAGAASAKSVFQFDQQISGRLHDNNVQGYQGSSTIKCSGGGVLIVEDNASMGSDTQTFPRVDLGDTTAGALQFEYVSVKRNNLLTGLPAGDEVINRAGHEGLEIDADTFGYESRVQPMRELAGQERVTRRLYQPAPTAAALPALGLGGAAGLAGSDIAGLLHLVPGTNPAGPGDYATITLGTPLIADPNGPWGPTGVGYVIHLTVCYFNSAPPQPSSFYYWFATTDAQHWTIGSFAALPGYDYWIAYRLVAL